MRWPWQQETLKREVPAVPPTIESMASEWIASLRGVGFSPNLIDRVWVAARCIQLNAQQIASMPLRFSGQGVEPAWIASPDPVWYPNGIGSALHAAVRSYYGWGDAFLYITGRYANGFPSAWTVLDPSVMHVELDESGRRAYRSGEQKLRRDDIVQITRDPGAGLRGSSALESYAAQAWSSIAGGELSQTIMAGGTVPPVYLKPHRKVTEEQARLLQAQWASARAASAKGVPAVVPPDIDVLELSIKPSDLLLLDAQNFDARVIASAFGVPPFLINLPLEGGLTYQNPEKLGEFWWRFELRPSAKSFADAFTAQMLPRGNAVVFDASDTFAVIDTNSLLDDSQTRPASPADENVRPLRPAQEVART